MAGLIHLRIEFSINDLGAGYSFLSRLKILPVHVLGIDQSFIGNIGRSADNEAIVLAVITLSKTMSIHVVAEGEGTKAQANFLLENGCSEGKGFFYYKPASLVNLEWLIAALYAVQFFPFCISCI